MDEQKASHSGKLHQACGKLDRIQVNKYNMIKKRWLSVGQVLVKLWSSIGEVLVKCWSSVGQVLVKCWSSAGQVLVKCWLSDGQSWSCVG